VEGGAGVPDAVGVVEDDFGAVEDNTEVQAGVDDDDLELEFDGRYGPRTDRYELRARRRPNYTLVNAEQPVENIKEIQATPQMNMRAGLKLFGESGAMAVKKEINQLHERKVMTPCHKKALTSEQRKDALGYLMFLKRKRCGKVKGRGCADGRKQREWIDPDEAWCRTKQCS
jgi:hypothetical protein